MAKMNACVERCLLRPLYEDHLSNPAYPVTPGKENDLWGKWVICHLFCLQFDFYQEMPRTFTGYMLHYRR